MQNQISNPAFSFGVHKEVSVDGFFSRLALFFLAKIQARKTKDQIVVEHFKKMFLD